ncbi:MAG: mannitol dehydrogenase [Epulopiscium sp. Nele67-Bin001]|nr:MAG: mannitol dehydrogenase [Epulopiscium sp. Nele67-Bin001]
MKLTNDLFNQTQMWEEKGISVPTFDVLKMRENTKQNPTWVHFGAGNIFRGFIAGIQNTLLEKGLVDTGIIAVDTFDEDIIDNIYKKYDDLVLLVKLKSNGDMQKQVLAGIGESVKGSDTVRLKQIFENPTLQIVSFTVTEKGYQATAEDIDNGPDKPVHAMGVLCSLLLARFKANQAPITLISMDNCSNNGEILKTAVKDIALGWVKKGYINRDFLDYILTETLVAFPCTMIDKITPRPAKEVEDELTKLGIEDISPIVTSKNTFIAPFVNAEVAEYLVIEDKFTNSQPPFKEVDGVYVTDGNTVKQVETMKVTTCLNPLHTALAIYGVILGYDRIYKEMENPMLKTLVEKVGLEEGMKVVVDPLIINPKEFIDEVIYERFTNPFIPDDPARIATDTSQKVKIRFGETIKEYIKSDKLDVNDLTYIPLVIAGWLRYLMGVNDKGEHITLSPDPLMTQLQSKLQSVKLGGSYNGEAKAILSDAQLFGVDLVECGLASKIEELFKELIAGIGAVEATLKKYCA